MLCCTWSCTAYQFLAQKTMQRKCLGGFLIGGYQNFCPLPKQLGCLARKQPFLPQNMLSWAHTGLAGSFGALLVFGVVARGLYLARHLFTLCSLINRRQKIFWPKPVVVNTSIPILYPQLNQPNWTVWRLVVKCCRTSSLQEINFSETHQKDAAALLIQCKICGKGQFFVVSVENYENFSLKVASNGKQCYEYLWVFSPQFPGSKTERSVGFSSI